MPEHHLNKRVTKLEEKVSHLEGVHTPRQEDEAGVGPQNTAEKKPDPAPWQPTPMQNVPSTPEYSSKAKDPWYKTLQGWYYLLGIIGIPFAIGYAVVTYFQWHDLRHNFVSDQRAWVNIAPLEQLDRIPVDSIQALIINARMVNSGKTPATKGIHIECVVDILSRP